jgi:hypothetical protein
MKYTDLRGRAVRSFDPKAIMTFQLCKPSRGAILKMA